MFLAEGPPPAEAHETGQFQRAGAGHVLDEGGDVLQRFVGSPVVRHDGGLAAKVQDGVLVAGVQADLIEDEHALGFAQDVVVQGAFGDAVVRRGLSEAHPLRHDGLDGLLQLLLGPRGGLRAPLHQRFYTRRVISGGT